MSYNYSILITRKTKNGEEGEFREIMDLPIPLDFEIARWYCFFNYPNATSLHAIYLTRLPYGEGEFDEMMRAKYRCTDDQEWFIGEQFAKEWWEPVYARAEKQRDGKALYFDFSATTFEQWRLSK